ncbi:MAG: hypothetical protein JO278_05450 [Dyella sp.]|nr:hypothetical protein [Dyella sp.]
MSNWLKARFSDPDRMMDTICSATLSLCAIAFVLLMILLFMARNGIKP